MKLTPLGDRVVLKQLVAIGRESCRERLFFSV